MYLLVVHVVDAVFDGNIALGVDVTSTSVNERARK